MGQIRQSVYPWQAWSNVCKSGCNPAKLNTFQVVLLYWVGSRPYPEILKACQGQTFQRNKFIHELKSCIILAPGVFFLHPLLCGKVRFSVFCTWQAPALLANIRLTLKNLPGTNSLALFEAKAFFYTRCFPIWERARPG